MGVVDDHRHGSGCCKRMIAVEKNWLELAADYAGLGLESVAAVALADEVTKSKPAAAIDIKGPETEATVALVSRA
jgi:hypothetical protein